MSRSVDSCILMLGLGLAFFGPPAWVSAVTLADVKELEFHPRLAVRSAMQAADWGPVLPSLVLTPAVGQIQHAAWLPTDRTPADLPLTLRMTFDEQGNVIATTGMNREKVNLVTPEQVFKLTGKPALDSDDALWTLAPGTSNRFAKSGHQIWWDIKFYMESLMQDTAQVPAQDGWLFQATAGR